jgi:predicted transcriptional regulator
LSREIAIKGVYKMKVLMSIKPKYADKIFSEEKKYEYRKFLWIHKNDKKIDTVIVYATSPIKKVIGEFYMDGVLTEEKHNLWNFTKHAAGISKDEYFNYFKGWHGHAIIVIHPILYKTPKLLSDYGIKRPPQNFMYLRD